MQMVKKINTWYSRLSNAGKLLIIALIFWLINFTIEITVSDWFHGEDKPISYHIEHTTIRALSLTIFLNWLKFKSLFSRKKNIEKYHPTEES